MTLQEAVQLIEDNEHKFMGEKAGDSGHVINGYEVFKNDKGEIKANILAFDGRSGIPVVKTDLLKWLDEKGKSL